MNEPTVISTKKCWERYTLEYATINAIKRKINFKVLLFTSIANVKKH